MNIVETCKCGGSIRLVGARQSISDEVAAFREAHEVCRQPAKPEVVMLPLPGSRALADMQERQRELDDMPCPKCGGDRLRPMYGEGGTWCHAPLKNLARRPEPQISDEAIARAKAQVPILDRLWDAVTDLPTAPCCPECGHTDMGAPACRHALGTLDGEPEFCGCRGVFHQRGGEGWTEQGTEQGTGEEEG